MSCLHYTKCSIAPVHHLGRACASRINSTGDNRMYYAKTMHTDVYTNLCVTKTEMTVEQVLSVSPKKTKQYKKTRQWSRFMERVSNNDFLPLWHHRFLLVTVTMSNSKWFSSTTKPYQSFSQTQPKMGSHRIRHDKNTLQQRLHNKNTRLDF